MNKEVYIMSEEIKADKVMDLKGLPCPMPVVKVSKGIKEVEVGQVIEALTSDPGALADFPAWAKTKAPATTAAAGKIQLTTSGNDV